MMMAAATDLGPMEISVKAVQNGDESVASHEIHILVSFVDGQYRYAIHSNLRRKHAFIKHGTKK